MGVRLLTNPLVYPGGINPGFNPNHVAVRGGGIRYSGIASSNGSMLSLLNPTPPTVLGAPTASLVAGMGRAMNCSGTLAAGVLTPGPIETPTAVTYGVILSINSGNSVNGHIFGTNGNNALSANETSLFISTAGQPFLFVNNSALFLGFSVPISGQPIFLAISYSAGKLAAAWCILGTGQIFQSGIVSVTAAVIQTPASSGYVVGYGSTTFAAGAKIAAVAYIINNFLQPAQLLQWVQKPRDFWYPSMLSNLISSVGKSAKAPVELAGNLGGVSSYG